MPDGSKGIELQRGTPFNEPKYPVDADFYDTKFHWYVKASPVGEHVSWQWWCWITSEWVVTIDPTDLPLDERFRLIKNPSIAWRELSERIKDPAFIDLLRSRCGAERPKLPFVRTKRKLATLTRYFTWPQRLYLCWFRGFERDPEAPGFSFIKRRESRRAK